MKPVLPKPSLIDLGELKAQFSGEKPPGGSPVPQNQKVKKKWKTNCI